MVDFVRTKRGRRDMYLAMVRKAMEYPLALTVSRYGTGLCRLYGMALTNRQMAALNKWKDCVSPYAVFARLPEVKLIAPTEHNEQDFGLWDCWVGENPDRDPFDPREYRLTALAMLITLSEDR